MSIGDAFQFTGAVAGVVSLLWLIGTQLFGTYQDRTIREVLLQLTSLNSAVQGLQHTALGSRRFR
jgi:hypothetical protein